MGSVGSTIGLLLLGILCVEASSACSGPLTVAPVTFSPYGSCDEYEGAALITGVTDYASFCPGLTCEGSYYALCDGVGWDSCACGIPSGSDPIPWSNFGSGVGSGLQIDAGSEATNEGGTFGYDASSGDDGYDGYDGGGSSDDTYDGTFSTEDASTGDF
jgi:hypothetical protein